MRRSLRGPLDLNFDIADVNCAELRLLEFKLKTNVWDDEIQPSFWMTAFLNLVLAPKLHRVKLGIEDLNGERNRVIAFDRDNIARTVRARYLPTVLWALYHIPEHYLVKDSVASFVRKRWKADQGDLRVGEET